MFDTHFVRDIDVCLNVKVATPRSLQTLSTAYTL